MELVLIIFVVILALLFDFGNGLNDAANSISTVVATRVLTPAAAVLLAAAANFIGAFVFTVAVAKTIGKGIISPEIVTPTVILAGLVGAIIWVYVTTYLGLPISASHSLIGGFVGSAIAAAGFNAVIVPGMMKILIFIFIAPLLGFLGGAIFSVISMHVFSRATPYTVDKISRILQIISSTAYSLSHGTNDAQKTMGIITLLLVSGGLLKEFDVPWWVILLSHSVIALGTALGGWKVVKTMGIKITKLRPVDGFCAETAGSLVIIGSTLFGIPVSTTHVIAGSITGVGSTKRISAVRWKIARDIVWAWILTIPSSALVGAGTYLGIRVFQ